MADDTELEQMVQIAQKRYQEAIVVAEGARCALTGFRYQLAQGRLIRKLGLWRVRELSADFPEPVTIRFRQHGIQSCLLEGLTYSSMRDHGHVCHDTEPELRIRHLTKKGKPFKQGHWLDAGDLNFLTFAKGRSTTR